MHAKDLILHCLAERDGDVWVAVCLDFALVAQASTLVEARQRLDAQIRDYVVEAVTVDKAYGAQLLRRRAPLRDWLKYWMYRWLDHTQTRRAHRDACSFREPMPLAPVAC